MAAVNPQVPDKAKEAKAQAAAATNVPQLREAVATLVEAVDALQDRIKKLETKVGR